MTSARVIPFPAKRRHEEVELTKRQLAEHWGVTTRTIELWVRDSGLPSVGIFAGRRIFNLADVEEWKRRRMESPTETA